MPVDDLTSAEQRALKEAEDDLAEAFVLRGFYPGEAVHAYVDATRRILANVRAAIAAQPSTPTGEPPPASCEDCGGPAKPEHDYCRECCPHDLPPGDDRPCSLCGHDVVAGEPDASDDAVTHRRQLGDYADDETDDDGSDEPTGEPDATEGPARPRVHKAIPGPHVSPDLAGVVCGRDGVERSTNDDALVTCKNCRAAAPTVEPPEPTTYVERGLAPDGERHWCTVCEERTSPVSESVVHASDCPVPELLDLRQRVALLERRSEPPEPDEDRAQPPPGWRWDETRNADGSFTVSTHWCTPDLPQLADRERAWQYHDSIAAPHRARAETAARERDNWEREARACAREAERRKEERDEARERAAAAERERDAYRGGLEQAAGAVQYLLDNRDVRGDRDLLHTLLTDIHTALDHQSKGAEP